MVEHVLGKDGVTGSIPVSSSSDVVRGLKRAASPTRMPGDQWEPGDLRAAGGHRSPERQRGTEGPIPVSISSDVMRGLKGAATQNHVGPTEQGGPTFLGSGGSPTRSESRYWRDERRAAIPVSSSKIGPDISQASECASVI